MIGGELERLLRQLVREEVRAALAEALPAPGGTTAGGFVSVAAYAAARSVGVSTVRQAIRENRLESILVGRSRRVPRDAVLKPVASPGKKENNATARAERRLGLVRGGRP